jgi:hypothetical protein
MDWLDQYLNGLGEYKITVSPADTHIWGVKPKLNNVQERMIFDAVAQSEQEFRQIVQEARHELEAHGHSDVADAVGADPGSPARASSPSVTPTPTVTPSIAVSPTPTPTITVTTSITPTMTVTPTITPSSTTYPGMLAANSPLIAVNYGNQSTFRFGTNQIVTRNYGYDPDIIWDWDSGTPPGYYVIFLDFNFNIPGAWSFQLNDSQTPSNRYQWKNNSTNSMVVPSAGWFGFAGGGGFVAGTTNLLLSAIPVSPTPTPSITPTITPTYSPTPTVTPTRWSPATAFVSLTTLAISAYLTDQGFPYNYPNYTFNNLRAGQKSWLNANPNSCDSVEQGIWHDGSVWNLRFYNAQDIEYVGCVAQYDITYTNNSPSDVVPLTGWPANVRIGKYLYNESANTNSAFNAQISLSGGLYERLMSFITPQGTQNRYLPRFDYFSSGTTINIILCSIGSYFPQPYAPPYGTSRRVPTMISSNTSVATVNNAAKTISFVGGGNVTIALTASQDNDYAGQCAFIGLRSTNASNPVAYLYQLTGGSIQNAQGIFQSISGVRVYFNNWSLPSPYLPFLRSAYVAKLSSGNAAENAFSFAKGNNYNNNGESVKGAVINNYPGQINSAGMFNCNSVYNNSPYGFYCYSSYSATYGGSGGISTDTTSVSAVSADYATFGLPIILNLGSIY